MISRVQKTNSDEKSVSDNHVNVYNNTIKCFHFIYSKDLATSKKESYAAKLSYPLSTHTFSVVVRFSESFLKVL